MELMCVETIMKRKEALGITDADKPSEESTNEEHKQVNLLKEIKILRQITKKKN